MRIEKGQKYAVLIQAASVLAASWLMAATARADAPSDTPAGSAKETAVWTPKELDFAYQAFTTKYTCDGLQSKMKRILIKLGARPDIQVRGFGCTQITRPDPFAGVRIQMNVLQPAAGADNGQTVPSHWETVDLLAGRDPVDAAGDCELVTQLKEKVLPLFTTRNVVYGATCERHQLLAGATRLKAEVLVADAHPVPRSIIR